MLALASLGDQALLEYGKLAKQKKVLSRQNRLGLTPVKGLMCNSKKKINYMPTSMPL